MEINSQSLVILRERLQHQRDMQRLAIVAQMADVELWKIEAWLVDASCHMLISEYVSLMQVMEYTQTIVLESVESLQLVHVNENERHDPYNYHGRNFR